jgi:hypothetical protein
MHKSLPIILVHVRATPSKSEILQFLQTLFYNGVRGPFAMCARLSGCLQDRTEQDSASRRIGHERERYSKDSKL